MARFTNRNTGRVNESYSTINQVIQKTVARKYKNCECSEYPGNRHICPHCFYKSFRLDSISLAQKKAFLYLEANYLTSSSGSVDYCECCGRTEVDLILAPRHDNIRVCKTCFNASITR